MPVVELRGCPPEPLAGYLKALAVFRLVSSQADPEAKAWWRGDVFCLESSFDANGLVEFFLIRYSPTPLVAPWNGGSGFYPGDRRDGIDALLSTTHERFAEYRNSIRIIRQFGELPRTEGMRIADMLDIAIGSAKKPKDLEEWQGLKASLESSPDLKGFGQLTAEEFGNQVKKLVKGSTAETSARQQHKAIKKLVTRVKKSGGGTKAEIVRACRNRLPDRAVEWLDAAAIVRADGELGYPPIMGTGGNEGRLDYTNSFMVRIKELLVAPAPYSGELLRSALYGTGAPGLIDASIGQFDPGRAGGFNQGLGVESSAPVNAWDQVLTLEGAAGWTGGIARRQRVNAPRLAVSPFTVAPSAVGYGSAADTDADGGRAELWMPLWSRPLKNKEFQSLLKEGRADVGRQMASNGLQFAQAVKSLRIDRGVREFLRFSLLKRRGDSYVALPAGRLHVDFSAGADLIRELTPLLDDITRRKEPGARLLSARRALEKAMFDYLSIPGQTRLLTVLQTFGRVVRQADFDHRRVVLGIGWLEQLSSVPEFRIAAALASLRSVGKIASFEYLRRGSAHFAWRGSDIPRKMASVAARRLMDADRTGAGHAAFAGSLPLAPEQLTSFLGGNLDDRLIEDLLFALTRLDWRQIQRPWGWARRAGTGVVVRDWALLKCLFAGDDLRPVRGQPGITVRAEPTVIPLLLAGRINEACVVAQRRLRASGMHPFRVLFRSGGDGPRLAAALLVPVAQPQLLVAALARDSSDSVEEAS